MQNLLKRQLKTIDAVLFLQKGTEVRLVFYLFRTLTWQNLSLILSFNLIERILY